MVQHSHKWHLLGLGEIPPYVNWVCPCGAFKSVKTEIARKTRYD